MRVKLESYKGLRCGCAPGTHDKLVRIIARHVKARAGVLDFGAHSGALLQRLRDHGFSDLTGADLDTTRFALPDAKFIQMELNQSFAQKVGRKFSLITCTDVIEHLDSPRHFMTECRDLLEDGGFLALSFPNVAFWEGRCKFMLTGELWGFGEANYRSQRHISPLTVDMTRMTANEVGYDVVECGTGGSFATPLAKLATFPVWGPLRLVGGPTVLGESLLVLLRKTEPNKELSTPTHYKNRWQGIPDRIGLE